MSPSPPSSWAGSTAPVARVRSAPPFVGRRREVDQLVGWLDDARAGRPQVALVVGDAGIGKTRLVRELAATARAHGSAVFAGRGYEDLTLPFLPIMEALAGRLREMRPEVESALGRDAVAFRELLGGGAAAPAERAGPWRSADQVRLVLAASRAIVELARKQPSVFLLDDLHWVDQPSLELFSHLVFTVADAAGGEPLPLLVVGSLRPVAESDRLARAFARFRREEVCHTLDLAGLSEAEVTDLVRGLGLRRPSHQMIALVSEATCGNPLFVQEVVHHLVRRGAIDERGGRSASMVSALDVVLPPDLAGAIAVRTRELGERCRSVLTLAAFVGDAFSLRTLCAVAGKREAEVLADLDEALARHLIASDGRGFQFVHPLIRQVLYAEPPASQRQLLHARIADALAELHGGRADEHVLEIAHHLVAAGPVVNGGRLLHHARRAGDRAFAQAAWSDAARYYRAALEADASGAAGALLDDRARAELHEHAGLAHFRDQDGGPCIDQYGHAVDIFGRIGDARGLARALMGRTRAQFTLASVAYGTLIDPAPLEDVRKRLTGVDDVLSGFVSAELAQVFWTARRAEAAEEAARRALAIGEKSNNDVLCAEAHRALALVCSQTMQPARSLEHLASGREHARRTSDRWLDSQMVQRMPLALLWLGRLDEAEARAREGRELTRALHDWGDQSLAEGAVACVALARGDFAATERHAQQAMTLLRRSGYPWAGPTVLPALARARALRGAFGEADEALRLLVEAGQVFDDPGPALQTATYLYCQLVAAWADDSSDAGVRLRERVGALPQQTIGANEAADVYGLSVLAALVEIAVVCGSPGIADAASDSLARAAERGVVFASGWVVSIARVLGVASALCRRWDAGENWFGAAIEQTAARGARPELALSLLGLAEMLAERGRRGDRGRATELVARARPLFQDLAMVPSIRAAERLGQRLEAGRRAPAAATGLPAAPTPTPDAATPASDVPASDEHHDEHQPLRTILFTDVVGSAGLFERLGDDGARAILRAHDAIVRECLERSAGAEIKHTGDGIMASFPSVGVAIDCAISIQRAITERNVTIADADLAVRIGLNAGEPLAEGGDLYGVAVNAAARLCARARPGEILVSDVVRSLARGKSISFVDRGRIALRGFAKRVHAFEVRWQSA